MQNNKLNNMNIGIIGAGWVGKALATALIENDAKVLVTGSSNESVQALTNLGFSSVKVSLPCASTEELPKQLLKQQAIVICIPPGIRYGKSDYQQKLDQIVAFIQLPESNVEQVIMLSSTAVYNGLQGEVNEHSRLDMNAAKVAIISGAEQVILQSKVKFKTVLRLGGLIGYNRQPGRFFSSDKLIPNPDSVINFIHRDDVIGMIQTILIRSLSLPQSEQNPSSFIYNGIADCHPTRKQLYQQAMLALNKPQPKFAEQQEINPHGVTGKQVNSLFRDELAYNFVHNDLLQWLKHSDE